MGKGVKHYLKSGKEWTGSFHKMKMAHYIQEKHTQKIVKLLYTLKIYQKEQKK